MIAEAERQFRKGSECLAVLERQNVMDPDILGSAQQAVESFVQALYSLLDLEFALQHDRLTALSREERQALLQTELRKIRDCRLPGLYPFGDQLPRVVFLTFAWSSFREQAECGSEALSSPLFLFFGREEARLALDQARLCHKAAKSLLELKK